MRWLRSLRPLRAERTWRASLSRTTFRRDPSAPVPVPLPTPRELVDVLGVGRTEIVEGRALTLLSLERYRESDVVTFRIARMREGRTFASPELRIAFEPAPESEPRVWSMGGSGGGSEELVWRISYAIAPPTPRGSAFTVVVTAIEWHAHEGGQRRIESVEPGAWRFAIIPP